MTNENYIEQLKLIVYNNHKCYWKILRKLKPLNEYIMKNTTFLPDGAKYVERVYCILNSINSILMCPSCGKNPLKFINISKGYRKYCCCSCSNSNEKVIAKK
jgi:hypothetical protein